MPILAKTPGATESALITYVNAHSAAVVADVEALVPWWARGLVIKTILIVEDHIATALYEQAAAAGVAAPAVRL